MSKILLVSIQAGGGHKTAMYSLGEILHKYAPTVEFDYFISSNEDLEKTHFYINTKFPWAYEIGYRLAENRIIAAVQDIFLFRMNRKLEAELTKVLKDQQYDLIISTHFLQTARLLNVRRRLKLDTKIIAYVPDFDLTNVHFPKVKGVTPDGVIAQNYLILNKLQRKYGLRSDQIQVAGFLTRPEFVSVRSLEKSDVRQRLNEQGFQLINPIGKDDFTIVFTGGSTWVNYAYDAVVELVNHRKINWKATQLIIICGNNKEALQKYSELAKLHPDKKIHPLPFLSYEQMSYAFRSADLVTMASIAPATLYELLEVGSAPIVVHHINPGQERANLRFALDNKLVEYIPRKGKYVKFVRSMEKDHKFAERVNQSFKQRAQATREIVRNNSIKTANFILNMIGKK